MDVATLDNWKKLFEQMLDIRNATLLMEERAKIRTRDSTTIQWFVDQINADTTPAFLKISLWSELNQHLPTKVKVHQSVYKTIIAAAMSGEACEFCQLSQILASGTQDPEVRKWVEENRARCMWWVT